MKKVCAGILAIILTISVLASCGNNSDTDNQQNGNKTDSVIIEPETNDSKITESIELSETEVKILNKIDAQIQAIKDSDYDKLFDEMNLKLLMRHSDFEDYTEDEIKELYKEIYSYDDLSNILSGEVLSLSLYDTQEIEIEGEQITATEYIFEIENANCLGHALYFEYDSEYCVLINDFSLFTKKVKNEKGFQDNLSLILGTWTTESGETFSFSNGEWDDEKINEEHYRLDWGAASIEMGYIDNIYALRDFIDFGSDFDYDRYSQMKIHYSSSLDMFAECYDKDITDNYILAIKVQWRMYPYIYVESVSDTQMVLVNEKNEKMLLSKEEGTNNGSLNLSDFEQQLLNRALEEIYALKEGDIDKYIDLINMDMIYEAHRNEMFIDGESLDIDELTDRVRESAYEDAYDLNQHNISGEPFNFEVNYDIDHFSIHETEYSFTLGECTIDFYYCYLDDGSMESVYIGWIEFDDEY